MFVIVGAVAFLMVAEFTGDEEPAFWQGEPSQVFFLFCCCCCCCCCCSFVLFCFVLNSKGLFLKNSFSINKQLLRLSRQNVLQWEKTSFRR